jgi:hypothetical protein
MEEKGERTITQINNLVEHKDRLSDMEKFISVVKGFRGIS